MAASSCEGDKSITQPSTSRPLSSEELWNVKWFLNDRKMSMRKNVTKRDTSAFLKQWLTLPQKVHTQAQLEFHHSLSTDVIHVCVFWVQVE